MSEVTTRKRSSRNPKRLRDGSRNSSPKVSQSYWAAEQEDLDTAVPLDERMALLQNHGDFSLAYSTAVQPCLRYFGNDNGYVAYRNRWRMTYVLGDPVADENNTVGLLRDFIAKTGKPSFCQVSHRTAIHLEKLGYFINQMGVDSTIDLESYNFAGKQKEWIRYAGNWIQKRGFTIGESTFGDLNVDQIEDLSEAWRTTRTIKRKEVRFLNRPIVLEDEPDVRKFFLFDSHGDIKAFVFLDPLYREGKLLGYVTSFKRRHPEAPQYAEHALMKSIIETLQRENVSELRLGLSPMASIEKDQFNSRWVTRSCFKMCYRSKIVNRFFYHLKGHAEYKRRFRGNEEKVFYASPGRFDSVRLMGLIALCGIA